MTDGMESAGGGGVDVRRLAGVARIGLEEAEAAALQGEVEAMLAFAGGLREADVEGVEAMVAPGGAVNVLREDVPAEGLAHEAAMAMAPSARMGQFAVPKVIE